MADQQVEFTDEELKKILNDPRTTDEDLAKLSPSEKARAQAMGGGGVLPFARPRPRKTEPGNATGKEFAGELAKMGELGLGFAFPEMGLPARLAMDATAGALTGALNEEDPLKRGLYNAGLDTVGAALAKGVPLASVVAGQVLGGKVNNLVRDAQAFIRERGRGYPTEGLPIGARIRTGERIKTAGKELEGLENGATAKIDLGSSITGAQQDLMNRLKAGSAPDSARKFVSKEEQKFIEEQAKSRGVQVPPTLYGPNGQPLPKTPPKVDLSVREAGELKRGQADSSKKIIEARKGGQYVGPKVDTQAQIEANRAKAITDAIEQAAPETRDANKRLSDLFTIKKVNDQLGAQANTLTRLGTMGARAAVGTGIGGAIGHLTGADVPTALWLGSMLGGATSPANVSRLGYGIGRIGESLPTAARGTDIITDILNKLGVLDDADATNFTEKDDNTPSVQRRRPRK